MTIDLLHIRLLHDTLLARYESHMNAKMAAFHQWKSCKSSSPRKAKNALEESFVEHGSARAMRDAAALLKVRFPEAFTDQQ